MGIRTDYHISCNRKTLLGKEGMFDTHLTDFEVIGDLVF